MLILDNLNVSLGGSKVLKDISFKFEAVRNYAIMGETGSGKTALAKVMSGNEMAESGQVLFKGQKVKGSLEQLIPGHEKIAYLSQYFELPPNYVVKDYLDFENKISTNDADRLKQICRIEHLLNRKTYSMSGGERQRIALAKKLMGLPELIILDEPFAHLDFGNRQLMREILSDFQQQYKTDVIFITHDFSDVFGWADEVLIIKEGRLHTTGTPRHLYQHPADDYTASLMGPWSMLGAHQIPFNIPQELPTGKKLFLRPDFFEIGEGGASFTAAVSSIFFNGYCHIISSELKGSIISVACVGTPPQIGEHIQIKYRPETFWFIS
jgi:iron(III) transport system ATP-binding protein